MRLPVSEPAIFCDLPSPSFDSATEAFLVNGNCCGDAAREWSACPAAVASLELLNRAWWTTETHWSRATASRLELLAEPGALDEASDAGLRDELAVLDEDVAAQQDDLRRAEDLVPS